MPICQNNDTKLYYEDYGSGFPILLIAPGGMRSAVTFWDRVAWNPIEQLSPKYRVIAMDQRNAGQSTGPIGADDSWHTYTQDQISLMDHLGIDTFHVAGMCIGGPYCMGLIEAAPERVVSAILFQTIGLSENRQAFYEMFDGWAEELKPSRPEVAPEAWEAFKENMYSGEFLFNVSQDFVSACTTPLLVLLGDDLYHPQVTSREIVECAPNARLIEQWKEPEHQAAAKDAIEIFLKENTPSE